jgi:hypothetical protein
VIEDWLRAFEDMPADLFEEGCRLWLMSTAERFPTPGQLRATIEPILRYRRSLAHRAESFLANT